MSVTLGGHRATPHRYLDPDRAAYRMRARTHRAAADARSRHAAEQLQGFTASEFGRALSAAFRRPSDGADPYPFRDGA